MKYLAVVSGGLDSVVMAKTLWMGGTLGAVVSFYYGQRHEKELKFAQIIAARCAVPWQLVNIRDFGNAVSSALTSGPNPTSVPEGHYTEDSMRATVVPNRNMVMLSIASGIAISKDFDGVAIATHAGDHAIYPDCRPEFIDALGTAIRLGNRGFCKPNFAIAAPFIFKNKSDIVKFGAENSVRFDETWSCYNGKEIHCGKCATCIERMEAFILAGVNDPTEYESWDEFRHLVEKGQIKLPLHMGWWMKEEK